MKKTSLMLNLFIAFCLVLGALAVTPAAPAYAATLTVDTLADEDDNSCVDGDCSLRDAIKAALPGDTIDFAVTGIIVLSSQLLINKDLTVSGPGPGSLTISGNHATRVFNIDSYKVVSISGLAVANGQVTDMDGAGILVRSNANLTLDNMAIKDNAIVKLNTDYTRGGGIEVWQSGVLTVTNSVISGNTAVQEGGGLDARFYSTVHLDNVIIDNNQTTYDGGDGGGVVIREGSHATFNRVSITNNSSLYNGGGLASDATTLTITNSLIAGNTTGGYGGGISLYGNGMETPTNTLVNVTISGNTAGTNPSGQGRGGGLWIGAAPVSLNNVTIANNTTDYKGGGISGSNNLITVGNSLIAGNTSTDTGIEDCDGSVASTGHNLIQATLGCTLTGDTTGNLVGLDPMLTALADNGGGTQTHALQNGSPAIDAGNDLTCESTDQRGAARPLGSHCDIGAYEFQPDAMTFTASASYDGWILESAETSNIGGSLNKVATTLRLGDDAANKQYRAILSFDTSSLPAGAMITSVTLRFKYAGKTGSIPFGLHGSLLADMCQGAFKGNPDLQLGDFKIACSKNKVLTYTNIKVDNWYSKSLNPLDFQYVNPGGVTQFRLRFAKDDNNDFGADFLKIYSGNAVEAADRPQLAIEYYIP